MDKDRRGGRKIRVVRGQGGGGEVGGAGSGDIRDGGRGGRYSGVRTGDGDGWIGRGRGRVWGDSEVTGGRIVPESGFRYKWDNGC